MSRSLFSISVATLGGLTFGSLAIIAFSGCDETASSSKGTSKFQVASSDSEKESTDNRKTDGAPNSDEVAPERARPNFRPTDGEKENGTGQKPPVVSGETLGAYRVPSGEPEEIQAFIQRLNEQQPRGATLDEKRADFVRIQKTLVAAADKLLASKDVVRELRQEAMQTKIDALKALAERGDETAPEQLMQFMLSLAKDQDPEIARKGRLIAYELEMMEQAQKVEGEDADAKPLVEGLKTFLKAEEKDADTFRVAMRTASLLDQLGKREPSVQAFRAIGEAFISSKNEEFASAGQSMLDQALLVEIEFQEKLEAAVTDKPDALKEFIATLDKVFAAEKLGAMAFDATSQSASYMEFTGHYEESKQILEQVGKAFKDHPEEKIAKAAARAVENGAKRLNLIGQPFVVEGDLLDGSKFDWNKYKGKVVLLDFWATWCGPCIKEMPNIQKNYARYKDKGFEVVGINCDDEKMSVERFLAAKELPWETIHSTDPAALGMSNPLATKCGVDAIPFLVLINAEGKVEDIHVHGEKLGEKLAAIFGGEKPADTATEEKPAAETGRKGPPPKKAVDGKTGQSSPHAPREESGIASDLPPSGGYAGPAYFIALADEEAKKEEEENPYLADAGLKPEELVEFIFKMEDKPKSIQKRPGFGEAIVDAADRILAAKPADKFQFIAIESKLASLHKRACLGDEKCDKDLVAFVDSLKEDTRDRVAREVKFFQLERQVIEADKLPLEELPKLLATLKEFYAKEKLAARHLRIASSTVALINRLEDGDAREKEFKDVGNLLAKSSDKELSRYGKKLAKAPAESESKLVGQPLVLAGNTTDGQAFNWAGYRGKVVLVDFWATWCGPCRREMPNVKALYEKHKAKGFEVVGVSLDKDLDALADYIAENAIPWSTLSGEETQDLAEKYGVRGIPTMMLVDKEGKIVGVAHNVGALTSKLEALLAAAPAAPAEKPAK